MNVPACLTDQMSQPLATDIKRVLTTFASEIGFDACRIASCAVPPHAQKFRDWLREGSHGEMAYMARGEEKRCAPEQILPGLARSLSWR